MAMACIRLNYAVLITMVMCAMLCKDEYEDIKTEQQNSKNNWLVD